MVGAANHFRQMLTEFAKLPLYLDAERLAQEISQFRESDWTSHPTGFEGNSAIILVSVGGGINDEFAISGQMQPTSFLRRCPYLQQFMQAIAAPISRSRLMRLAPGAEVPLHKDTYYHWYQL
ncbi:MAG: hypothetical protein AB4426_24575 [Xenococcaceae cyanobacterium]